MFSACGNPTRLAALLLALFTVFTTACSGPTRYTYHYVPGKTATLHSDGLAEAPTRAPGAVRAAIVAGNRIAGSEYVYGGGHGGGGSGGYDCSGATSYVLRAAGCLRESSDSNGFRRYGSNGEGDWISVYARSGHVFLVIAGLRLDTGWTGAGHEGVRWTKRDRPADGCVVRHPAGL